MIALKITDLRDFTNKLFIREVFDSFWLNQAEITTYNTFSIDGKLHTDFLDSDQLQILQKSGRTYSLWKETRPFCWSVIRGKRTPLSFKIVLKLSKTQTQALAAQASLSAAPSAISGLYLNLQFKNKILLCTTGTAFNTFIPDKRLEQLWDGMVLDFFSQHQIIFEEM